MKKTDETWYHTDVDKQQVVIRASREVLISQEGFGQTSGQSPEQVISSDVSKLEHWHHGQGQNINL